MDIITELNNHHHSNHVLDELLSALQAYGTRQCTETPATQSKSYSIPQTDPMSIQGCGFQCKTIGMSEDWAKSSDLLPHPGEEVCNFGLATSSADLDLSTSNMQTAAFPPEWTAGVAGENMMLHSCITSMSPGYLSAKASSVESCPQNFMCVAPQVFSVPIEEHIPSNFKPGPCPTPSGGFTTTASRTSKATPTHGPPGTHVCIPPPCNQHWKSSRFAGNSCSLHQHSVGASHPPEVVDMPQPNPYNTTSCTSTQSSAELAASSSATMEEFNLARVQAEVVPAMPSSTTSGIGSHPKLDHGVTTLAIRNLPPRFTKEVFLKKWPSDGMYDFIYLPFSRKQRRTAGYAFMNFISHEAALAFHSQWDQKKLDDNGTAKKRLDISAAEVQGLDGNIQHWIAGNVEHTQHWQHLPSVFNGGEEVAFTEVLNNFAGRASYS